MAGWQAKKFQLPNHNFETTAIKFDDGRVGLCYHGSTIWQHDGGGWEDFIDSDWNTVWKQGKPCSFQELPPDMRVACPVCGAKIHTEDVECSQCGIIFDKMKNEPAPVESAKISEDKQETPRSRLLDFSLALGVLLIAGFFLYNAFKPAPPPQEIPQAALEDDQSGQSEQSTRRAKASQPTSSDWTENDSQYPEDFYSTEEEEEEIEEEDDVEYEDYYSHIDLDDLENAHRQLLEETTLLNEAAETIREDLLTAETPEETRLARQNKTRYDQKSLQLSQLIKEFNERNKDTP